MAKVIMVQGTMSGVGKSLMVAGLCRIFKQDGYRVAPFKSQNMALNSYITEDGLEMGRAQVMQAEAAGIKPNCNMNPILLKPTNNTGSQVIVNGRVLGNMGAVEYFSYKKQLIPDIMKAYRELDREYDIIVIEGAGSPAEINLKENDIVNMGVAKLVHAPVILVGDIDRGGVFAQLLGTLMLLEEDERAIIGGLVVNKFRGDKTILDPGIKLLEEKSGKRVVGVVPYTELNIDDEDSQTDRFKRSCTAIVNIGVIHYPRISNISDFTVFEAIEGVAVHYIKRPEEIYAMDMVILPGSKNTIEDLIWMRECGIEAAVKKASEHIIIFGICGGYQMLGMDISDPYNVENHQSEHDDSEYNYREYDGILCDSKHGKTSGIMRGLELLNMSTVLDKKKTTENVSGVINEIEGELSFLSGMNYAGYEIHHGISNSSEGDGSKSYYSDNCKENVESESDDEKRVIISAGNVYGTYVHGIFDAGYIAYELVHHLARKKGVELTSEAYEDYRSYKELQYDKLADTLRDSMDMDIIYDIMGIKL